MALEFAVLGFLRTEPLSGYDLKKRFDASVRHFWPADRAQIYRTLKLLAARGWVRVEAVPQAGKPEQLVHHITDAGSRALTRWLTQPLPAPEVREATLIQVYFADAVSDADALQTLMSQRDQIAAELERLRALEAELGPIREGKRSVTRGAFFRRLTLEHGIALFRAEVDWLNAAIAELGKRHRRAWKAARR